MTKIKVVIINLSKQTYFDNGIDKKKKLSLYIYYDKNQIYYDKHCCHKKRLCYTARGIESELQQGLMVQIEQGGHLV